MKSGLFFFGLILLFNSMNGQNKTIISPNDIHFSFQIVDSSMNRDMIAYRIKDSSIIIVGDTMKLIKMMMQQSIRQDSIIEANWKTIYHYRIARKPHKYSPLQNWK